MTAQNVAKSFASLFRNSKFVKAGDYRNTITTGKIYNITKDDLYIDVGLKFHAVCKKPQNDNRLFVRGAIVKLRLLDYEITDRFIGTEQDASIMEADAVIIGLESTPVGSMQPKHEKEIFLKEAKEREEKLSNETQSIETSPDKSSN